MHSTSATLFNWTFPHQQLMHVYPEKDPVSIKVKDIVLSVACVSWRKLMHAVKDLSLRIAKFWRIGLPLGWRWIIHKEQCKEIGAWREKRKVGEKPRLPVSIYEDCIEHWLAVWAKALYNSYVSPPCIIIQIVGFLAKAFPKVFSCILCIDSSSSGYIVQLDL